MSGIEIASLVFGMIGVLLAGVFGYAAFSRNKKVDDTGEAKQTATVASELGYIKSGIDDIKRKQEKQDQQHIEVITRLTAVEASARQAHKRLDDFVGRAREKD